VTSDLVRIETLVERKDPSLPRFVVIPSQSLLPWMLHGTTTVQVTLNDVDLGRRSLKRWGRERDCWFVDLTSVHCKAAGVDTGDRAVLEVRRATTELPDELTRLIAGDSIARRCWEALSPARQRALAEHVRAAKQAGTRVRRAAAGLAVSR
jgi:Bacteriocin-protection, YdeI or OmpD-Associated